MNISSFLFLDSADEAMVSNVFSIASNGLTFTFEVSGTFTGVSLKLEGKVDRDSEQWTTLSVVNIATSANVSDITSTGLYKVGVGGMYALRMNLVNIDSGSIKVVGKLIDARIYPSASASSSGIPAGGTTGQILAKNSNTDGDVEWITLPSSGGIDTPPIIPSMWDDEFNNGNIDVEWLDYNLASGSKSEDLASGCMIIGAMGTGLSHQGIVRTSPTGNFTMTAKLAGGVNQPSFRYGLLVAESTTTKSFSYSAIGQGGSFAQSVYEVLNSPTNRASYNLTTAISFPMDGSGYIRMYIYNDSGTWKAKTYHSANGIRWVQVHDAIAIGFTPAYIGIFADSEDESGINTGYFDWFRVVEG